MAANDFSIAVVAVAGVATPSFLKVVTSVMPIKSSTAKRGGSVKSKCLIRLSEKTPPVEMAK